MSSQYLLPFLRSNHSNPASIFWGAWYYLVVSVSVFINAKIALCSSIVKLNEVAAMNFPFYIRNLLRNCTVKKAEQNGKSNPLLIMHRPFMLDCPRMCGILRFK